MQAPEEVLAILGIFSGAGRAVAELSMFCILEPDPSQPGPAAVRRLHTQYAFTTSVQYKKTQILKLSRNCGFQPSACAGIYTFPRDQTGCVLCGLMQPLNYLLMPQSMVLQMHLKPLDLILNCFSFRIQCIPRSWAASKHHLHNFCAGCQKLLNLG